ncbi:MAG TPA: TOMM precursor leader peptide-binding protein [Pseudonocardiaceae bacterium]|nr:TOMM precursor leader peptide-binding protein [Pseudonocardiaceae bacterium]
MTTTPFAAFASYVTDPLPRRPRVLPGLPVLRRAAGEAQIGTDPRHAVVVTDVPEPVVRLLHGLDGRLTADELLARAGPDHRRALRGVLAGLAGLGLVDDAEPALAPPAVGGLARLVADRTAWMLRGGRRHSALSRLRDRAVVVVQGSGRIAVAVATLLAASGVGWVHTVAGGVVLPADTGSGYLDEDIGHARAEAAERAVRRIAPATRTGPPSPRQPPDLVLLTDATVADPAVSAGLAAAGVPHLMVHAAEGTGVVGPLVVPGRTSCLRCVDLHNTDVDPCWPALAAQLADHPQPADLASAQATAAFSAGQALRFLHGSTSERDDLPVWGAAVEIDVFTGRCTRIEWRPHARCPCGVATQGAYQGLRRAHNVAEGGFDIRRTAESTPEDDPTAPAIGED